VSCALCKMTLCKLWRVNTGQDASIDTGVPCRKSRTGEGDQGEDCKASLTLAGGVRGRELGMQGPGDSDPGEEAAEATSDARSVLAHGRAGGVRGRQRELMESTLLEGRGLACRLLGETQDADQGEMVTQVMPDSCRNQSGRVRVPRESGRDGQASRVFAGGVRGREREMQGPVDPGEEATLDALSVSAHSVSAHGRVVC
jgi:hypothetical protein